MTIARADTTEPMRMARPPPQRPRRRAPLREAFDSELVALIPSLKSFARALCANGALADDLVQDTCASALAHYRSFKTGTNMRAWLFAILRNGYYSRLRKHKREVEDADGRHVGALTVEPAQDASADLRDVVTMLGRMPPQHQDVLILVGRDGFSYEEAARRSGCALGTIKSRTNRARRQLSALMSETFDGAAGQGKLVGNW